MYVVFSYKFDDTDKIVSVPILNWSYESTLTDEGNTYVSGSIEIETFLIELEDDLLEADKLFYASYSDHRGWRAIKSGEGSVAVEILEMVPDIRKYLTKNEPISHGI